MRAPVRTPSSAARYLVVAMLVTALVATLVATLPGLASAQSDEQRLQEAQQREAEVQARLNELLVQLDGLEAELGELEAQLADLRGRQQLEEERAEAASETVGRRLREAYMHGTTDPMLLLLTSDSPGAAREHARILGALALRSRAEMETASAAQTQIAATAADVAATSVALDQRRADVDGVRSEVATLLGETQGEVAVISDRIEAERERQRVEQERREREERERAARDAEREAARQLAAAPAEEGDGASANDGGSVGGGEAADEGSDDSASAEEESAPEDAPASAEPAAPVGGIACPIGSPRSYSDTYGAARSGGRAHRGTDILAPMGTPIFAYEDGSITRMNGNRLGGISLYLMGDSGNLYYYTHLQGYVGGLAAGQRVSTGQQIAYNGDTGNARGIPHLHFEVMPGGGGNVNPYPYVQRACG